MKKLLMVLTLGVGMCVTTLHAQERTYTHEEAVKVVCDAVTDLNKLAGGMYLLGMSIEEASEIVVQLELTREEQLNGLAAVGFVYKHKFTEQELDDWYVAAEDRCHIILNEKFGPRM